MAPQFGIDAPTNHYTLQLRFFHRTNEFLHSRLQEFLHVIMNASAVVFYDLSATVFRSLLHFAF